MKRALLRCLLCLFLIFPFRQTIYAQGEDSVDETTTDSVKNTPVPVPDSSLNLTLSPVTLFLETDPGKSVQSTIRVRNNSAETEYLKISLGKFTADETGEKPKLLDADPSDPAMEWVSFDKTEFSVPPAEWGNITLDFHPPSNAAFSYYYTILVSRQSNPEADGGQTQLVGSPAILLLTTVNSPHAKRELSVQKFLAKFPIQEFLPQEFEIHIQNKGNVHVIPEGNIFIDGQGKKDLAVLSINSDRRAILPNSSRTYTVKWDDGFPKRSDSTDDEKSSIVKFWGLEWDFSKAHTFRFGRYTAHLLMVYDNGERDVPIESFITFWIIPWKILLLLLFVLLLVIVGVRSIILSIVRTVRR